MSVAEPAGSTNSAGSLTCYCYPSVGVLQPAINTRDPPDATLLEHLLGDLRELYLKPGVPLLSDLISAYARPCS
ncbi:Os08g0349100 [Oryza sativa Japonica Group]|uniref:Os08g0349100 protein n=1 Tax=Oryza sativa subsp. japonica TaxID=39947 RepID=A0A0P0XEM2_ORYSJ|nr:Os08g0349100 [Oryza sativa Japonica Group]